MVEASVGRALPDDDGFAAAQRRERPSRRAARPSSWRHIPLLTVTLATVLVAALFMSPAADETATAPSRERPALSLAAPPMPPAPAPLALEAQGEPEGVAAWVPIERPFAPFNLEAPELDRLPRRHDAARHTSGGGRDDVFVFGAFEADALHLRLSAYRPGGEAPASSTFFVDLVRRAGEAGLAVVRSAVAAPLTTKLGAVEAADAVLSGQGGERPCLAFRFLSDDPALRLSGWLCGTRERPADRATFACLIDRFDLIAAQDDKALAAFFAKAELARGAACRGPYLLVTGRTSPWLEGSAALPPLKSEPKTR